MNKDPLQPTLTHEIAKTPSGDLLLRSILTCGLCGRRFWVKQPESKEDAEQILLRRFEEHFEKYCQPAKFLRVCSEMDLTMGQVAKILTEDGAKTLKEEVR